MTIYNSDGSVYKPKGSLSQLGVNTPTHDLFNKWDQEIIRIGGSPIYYYEVIIPVSTIDKQYWESKAKLFTTHPIELYAVYEPVGSQMYQDTHGIDGRDTITFLLNYQATIDAIGHIPTIGSRIYTPHLGENWEVIQYNVGDFQRYKVYRIEIHCIKFQEDLSIQGGKVTDDGPKPNFTID